MHSLVECWEELMDGELLHGFNPEMYLKHSSVAMKRHHGQGNTYEGKHLTPGYLRFQRHSL